MRSVLGPCCLQSPTCVCGSCIWCLLLDTGQDREQRSAAMRLLPTLLAGACLLVIAAFLDTPYREWAWVLAALIDLGGPLVLGVGGLRVLPRYFVDRHGSIIIIAL